MPSFAELVVDDLDGDLARRRRELIDLRLLVSSARGSRLGTITRACHVMAYAHWEGFVKYSLRTYLDHVIRLRLPVGDLQPGLQALAVRQRVILAAQPDRAVGGVVSLLEHLDTRHSTVFEIDSENAVKVGNLTAENFRALLEGAGLKYLSAYATRENYIDTVLCGRRHRVAHGGWQPVTSEEARGIAADVMDLCAEVNAQVQTAVVYEEFRK